MLKYIIKLYWKFKRWEAESDLEYVEHQSKFTNEFFCGTLYERKKEKLENMRRKATKKLKIADKQCKIMGID